MSDLHVVPEPTLTDVLPRYQELHDAAAKQAERAIIGGLVAEFTNDELYVLASSFTIAETCALRRMGLLNSDEGFDGSKQSRQWCAEHTRLLQARQR